MADGPTPAGACPSRYRGGVRLQDRLGKGDGRWCARRASADLSIFPAGRWRAARFVRLAPPRGGEPSSSSPRNLPGAMRCPFLGSIVCLAGTSFTRSFGRADYTSPPRPLSTSWLCASQEAGLDSPGIGVGFGASLHGPDAGPARSTLARFEGNRGGRNLQQARIGGRELDGDPRRLTVETPSQLDCGRLCTNAGGSVRCRCGSAAEHLRPERCAHSSRAATVVGETAATEPRARRRYTVSSSESCIGA